MKLTIEKLARSEHQGDWHDKPLRWAVRGPGLEVQKFSVKAEAKKYAARRRRHADQSSAIRNYSLTP
jgi:hypothetical protein